MLAQAWYNFACGAAIAGRHDEALQYLRQAIDYGYGSAEGIASDPDLKSLHGDPRFEALVPKAREAAAAAQKSKQAGFSRGAGVDNYCNKTIALTSQRS